MKKRIISIVTAIVLVISAIPFVTGCGGRTEGELRIWWPGATANEIQALRRAAELFSEERPEVTFDIVPRTVTNFVQEYVIAVNGRNYPDIAFVDSVFIQQLAHDRLITNLSDACPEIDTTIRAQVVPSLWPANLYGGDAFALPVSANVLTLVYNRGLLRRVFAGTGREWADDMVPETWEELIAISEVFEEYNYINNLTGLQAMIPYTLPAGLGHNSFSSMAFVSMAARMGGSIMTDDLRRMSLYNPAYETAAYQAARKIRYLGTGGRGFVPPEFQESRFEAGQVGFIEMGPWRKNVYELITNSPDNDSEFRYAPMIRLKEGGGNQSTLGLFSMVSTAGGVNEALAVEFMKFFLTNDEVMLLHNQPQNLLPVTVSTIADPFYSEGDVWPVFMEQMNHIAQRPGNPEWAVMERRLGEFVTGLLSGSNNPSDLRSLHTYLNNRLREIYP